MVRKAGKALNIRRILKDGTQTCADAQHHSLPYAAANPNPACGPHPYLAKLDGKSRLRYEECGMPGQASLAKRK